MLNRHRIGIRYAIDDKNIVVWSLDKTSVQRLKRGERINNHNIHLKEVCPSRTLSRTKCTSTWALTKAMVFSKMKSKIKEYNRQVRLALRSKPNAKNKISAINILAVPVPTYSFSIVHWSVKEIKKMDRKTRKLLMVHGMRHPKADAD